MPLLRSPACHLLRHAQARLASSDYDRLSELGQTQAGHLAGRVESLANDSLQYWSGSLRRHRQTLAQMAPMAPARVDEALNEYAVDGLIRSACEQAGRLGLAVPQAEAFADPVTYLEVFLDWFPEVLQAWQGGHLECIKNGTWSAFSERVTRPLAGWRQQLQAGHSIVVVSSAGVISTILAHALQRDLGWQRRLNVELYNASLSTLRLDARGRWRADFINCTEHLGDDRLRTLA